MATIRCGETVFPSIQAIFFDKDGTLADSAQYLRELAQRRSRLIDAQIPGVQDPMRMAFGVEGDRLDPSGLMALGTRYENEIAAAAYVAETGRGWIEALTLVRAAFQEADVTLARKADHTPPFAGIDAMLRQLHGQGIILGVLSADSPALVTDFLQRYELADVMAIALGSTEALRKPEAAFYHQACAQVGVDPAATVLVGDSPADVELAAAGGAAGCVGVSWGWSTAVQLQGATVQIDHVDQIEVLASPVD
jgi:phosphoglycolate phosphatase